MDAEANEAGATKYKICIKVGPNNELSVGVEPASAEAAEGGEAGESAYQPAKSIKDALTLALSAFRNDGVLPDMGAQNAAFDEGFGSGPNAGGDMGKMRGAM